MSRLGSFLTIGALAFPLIAAPHSRPATGSIAGVVQDESARPIAGAIVTADGTLRSARSGSDGRYRLDSLPTGPHRFAVRAVGYSPSTRSVTVLDGKVVTADFRLRTAPLALEELAVSQVRARKSAGIASAPAALGYARRDGFNTEEYQRIYENGWMEPGRRPLSTFSIDVDAASYTNIRRFVSTGQMPVKDAVRIEEMLNYFRYDYAEPTGSDPVSINTELGTAPWNPRHRLALIGLQSRRISTEALPPNNLVFLIDVSGSMDSPDKLPLVKAAFRLLVQQLRPSDRVAMVVYAGAAGLVLPSTPGDRKEVILDAIERLEAGGSTAGAAGIRLAYETARNNLLSEGNNRVILATDGDFNVGVSSEGELIRLIESEREHGVFLTVLGFGTGNLKDARMEQLADKGNGHYAYVNDIMEARRVFVQELGATLLTVAKDVKLQIEFNPSRVRAYRLIGYENRILADEDFNDDKKDAGELGAGHSVTALYEIVPAGVPLDVRLGTVDSLKYQTPLEGRGASGDEWMTVKLRYKPPTGSTSKLLSRAVEGEPGRATETFRFATAVAGVGMLLRESEEAGTASYAALAAQARGAIGRDPDGYRMEFVRLVETLDLLARRKAN